jgi:phosphate transport system substrate-binding protein
MLNIKTLIAQIALVSLPTVGFAEMHAIKGSDTMAGIMLNAITEADMAAEINYLGGGSGKGEAALVAGEQGIAPLSRLMKPEAIAQARANGVEPIGHAIGLDGIAVFVNHANIAPGMTLEQIKKIFTCEITDWTQVSGSGFTGPIKVFRRDDISGTTDTFKTLVGLQTFGACVTVLAETADIAYETSHQTHAVGYSGLSAQRDGNRTLALAKNSGEPSYLPVVANIRSGAYPLARTLYVYETTGARLPSSSEVEFLGYMLDRSFLDPILQANGFFTLN